MIQFISGRHTQHARKAFNLNTFYLILLFFEDLSFMVSVLLLLYFCCGYDVIPYSIFNKMNSGSAATAVVVTAVGAPKHSSCRGERGLACPAVLLYDNDQALGRERGAGPSPHDTTMTHHRTNQVEDIIPPSSFNGKINIQTTDSRGVGFVCTAEVQWCRRRKRSQQLPAQRILFYRTTLSFFHSAPNVYPRRTKRYTNGAVKVYPRPRI